MTRKDAAVMNDFSVLSVLRVKASKCNFSLQIGKRLLCKIDRSKNHHVNVNAKIEKHLCPVVAVTLMENIKHCYK